MDYVQTVLFKVAATKVDAALASGGLLDELEQHRSRASAEGGFHGMNVTRTAHPEGDLLVVVETRWATNNAMADYSALSENAEAIARRHDDLLVADSLEVHRMESVTSDRTEGPTRTYNRLALALLVPIGVLAFAVLAVYGLSRIYLAIPTEAATPVAAVIALAILLIAWYFASNPSAPRWQVAAVFIVGALALGIGGTAAAIYDEEHKEVHVPSPTPPPGGGTPPPPGAPVIDMEDNEFVSTSITVTQGAEIAINNLGRAIHNVHVKPNGDYADDFCSVDGPELCSDPERLRGGESGILIANIDPGTYEFRCDYHPVEMVGELTVQ